MEQIFRFYKTADRRWYIDLPEWTGDISALEMVEGADTMLDTVSDHANECHLSLSLEPAVGKDAVVLEEDLRDSVGGGYYVMKTYRGETINHRMWLCEVTEYVFNGLPPVIYVGYPGSL